MKYNYILTSSVLAWFLAQIIKTIIVFVQTKKFNFERLFGPGGMPSGHSAMVCSAVVAVGRQYGVYDFEFAMIVMFALVVLYDAMGVRREAGHHAHEINIIKKMMNYSAIEASSDSPDEKSRKKEKELKEILGHTPLQCLCGGALGVIIALVFPMSL